MRDFIRHGLFLMSLLVYSTSFAQSFYGDTFAESHWSRNPLTHPEPRKVDLDFLQQTANNPRFAPFLQIQPREFRIISSSSNTKVQAMMDGAVENILRTPTGRRICQKSTGGEWQRLRTYFGLSEERAKKLSANCQMTPSSPLIIKHSYRHEWVWVEYQDEAFPIHGWTTPQNVTFLFLKKDEVTELQFYRSVIHEIATALDSKESWGLMGNLNLAPKINRVLYSGQQNCEIVKAIKRPTIKFATSALRAEAIEDQILSELGLIEIPKPSEDRCVEKIIRKIPEILAIGDIVSADTMSGRFHALMCAGSPDKTVRDIFSDLEIIEEEKVQDLESGQTLSVCDYLTSPRVDSYFIGPYTGGPRPKIEPWEQTQIHGPISQNISRALRDKEMSAERSKLAERIRQLEEDRSQIGQIPERKKQVQNLLRD